MNTRDILRGYGPNNMMRRLAKAIKEGHNCHIQFEQSTYCQFSKGNFKELVLLKHFKHVTVEIRVDYWSWRFYMLDPKVSNEVIATEIKILMGVTEELEGGPDFTFAHHPPSDFDRLRAEVVETLVGAAHSEDSQIRTNFVFFPIPNLPRCICKISSSFIGNLDICSLEKALPDYSPRMQRSYPDLSIYPESRSPAARRTGHLPYTHNTGRH